MAVSVEETDGYETNRFFQNVYKSPAGIFILPDSDRHHPVVPDEIAEYSRYAHIYIG